MQAPAITLWSDRYDRELTDIFALQDEITASVIAAIEPKLVAAEGVRAEARSGDDLDAWDLVARALFHFWKFSATDNATAIGILREAVHRHPDYAPAHSMLASALLLSSYVGWTAPGSERELASALAERAAVLDEAEPWAHMALGILALTGRDTDEAVRHFGTALDLNPNFSTAAGFVGFALALDARSQEALRHFERAMHVSPRDPFNSFFFAGIAVAHHLEGRFAEAVKWARQATQLRPGYVGGHRILCASLAKAGHEPEAKAALAALQRMTPGMSMASLRQSVPYTDRTIETFLEGLRRAGLPD